jgi:hypothetical protein
MLIRDASQALPRPRRINRSFRYTPASFLGTIVFGLLAANARIASSTITVLVF